MSTGNVKQNIREWYKYTIKKYVDLKKIKAGCGDIQSSGGKKKKKVSLQKKTENRK